MTQNYILKVFDDGLLALPVQVIKVIDKIVNKQSVVDIEKTSLLAGKLPILGSGQIKNEESLDFDRKAAKVTHTGANCIKLFTAVISEFS